MRAPDPGAALASLVGMKAADLDAAFASLPPAWAAVLPGWTRERLDGGAPLHRGGLGRPADRPGGSVPRPSAGRAGRGEGRRHRPGPVSDRRPCRRPGVLGRQGPAALAGAGLRGAGRGPAGRVPAARGLDARRLGAARRAAAQPGADGRGRRHRQPHATAVGRRSLSRSSNVLSRRAPPPTFLLWGAKAQAFWASADPGRGAGPCSPATRPTTSTEPSWRRQSFRGHRPPRRLVGHRIERPRPVL